MRLGLLTAAFPSLRLQEVAAWAAAERFQALEIACWPESEAADRRYGGVCHLDVASFDPASVLEMMAERELEVSALAFYENNLSPNEEDRAAAHRHLRAVIDAAEKLGVSTVATFVGNDSKRTISENLAAFRRVWPDLVAYAAERGVRIAIENCPMLFSADEWPGGHNLAWSPAIWDEMFDAVPDSNFGLNLDPSHLIWLMIDYERVVRDYAERIFHVHAKDLEIDREGLYRHGVLSGGVGWQVPRVPGLGEVDWGRFVGALHGVGYEGTVSVEHEDRALEGSEDLVKRGFRIARDTLTPLVQ